MENMKVKVNNWDESKEVQELFITLGANCGVEEITSKWVCLYNGQITFYDLLPNVDFKQVTLQYLRDLVVLKRNSVEDARFKDTFGDIWYVDSTNSYWMFENDIWREAEEPLFKLEPIKKPIENEVRMKEKEYIAKVSCDWRFVESHELVSGRIEVPEGAEIFLLDKSFGEDTLYFVKHDGDVFHEYYINATDVPNNTWIKGTIKELHKCMGKVLWERNITKTDTSIQEKLKSINKEGDIKMKEYLDKEYRIRKVKQTSCDNCVPSGWIEVPEGAEEYRSNGKFYKNNGEFFCCSYNGWSKSLYSTDYSTVWKRNTAIQEKLKFIEKWLNGEKIQYILGIETEKTQWYNFTEGAMQYIKRSDIKFREAPKHVTINGIEFKSVEKLVKYVKNNFDLEDEE